MRERCTMILGFAQGCAKDEYFFCDRSRFLLMLVREDRTDEGQELFVGIGVGELGSPTLVEFHKTRCSVVFLRAPVIFRCRY